MPQLIQYGDSGAVIEFPDGLGQDQIAAILHDRKDELTERFSKGRLASAGSSFGKSFVEGVGQTASGLGRTQAYRIPGILRSLGMQSAMADESAASKLFLDQARTASTPIEREKLVQQEPLYQTGKTISAAAGDVFQPNPKYAGEFFTDVLPSGAGSTIPIIPTAAVAGPIPAVIQYGLQQGESAAQEAEAAGRPDTAGTAFLANAGVGALSELTLGVPANIMRYVKAARGAGVAPEVAGRAIKQELGSKISQWLAKNPVKAVVGEGVAREFTQEGLEQVGQNLIASELAGYDPNRPLTAGVVQAAAAGGILGGLFSGGAYGIGAAEPALRRRALTSSVERAMAASKAQEETAKRAAEDLAIERAIRRRSIIPTEERRSYAQTIRGDQSQLPATGTQPEEVQGASGANVVETSSGRNKPVSPTTEAQTVASPSEITLYLAGRTPNQSTDLSATGPGVVQSFDRFDVDAQKLVLSRMLSALHHDEIFNSVIQSVPIDVVNDFVGRELSSDQLFHNKAMLLANLASASVPETPIGTSVIKFADAVLSSLEFRRAFDRTKIMAAAEPTDLALFPLKGGPASLTSELHVSNVSSQQQPVKQQSTPPQTVAIAAAPSPAVVSAGEPVLGIPVEPRPTGTSVHTAVNESLAPEKPPVQIYDPILNTAVAQWRSERPTAPQLTIINDPALVRTDAQGNDRGVRGLWRGGQFTLNRAFIGSPEEARSVLEHEHAHSLLSSPEGAQAIREAVAANLGQQDRADLRQRYVRRAGETDPAYESRVMEEWLSSLAEQNLSIWQRIIAKVRQWLSKAGFVRLSDEEIGREMLRALRVSRLTPEAAASERESLTNYTFKSFQQKLATQVSAIERGAPQEGIAESERIAEVQAGLVPQALKQEVVFLNPAPKTVEGKTRRLLQFVLDLSNVAQFPQQLATLPRGPQATEAQIRESELAAGTLLSHHLFLKSKLADLQQDLDKDNVELVQAVSELPQSQLKDLESEFANAMASSLVERYDTYLANKRALATEGGNLTVALDKLIDRATQQIGEYSPRLGSIAAALQAIARNIPDDMVKAGTAPQQILAWVENHLPLLQTQTGEEALYFIIRQKGIPGDENVLISPLIEYEHLADDLRQMKEVQKAKDTIKSDVESFKQWFAANKKPPEVGPLKFAREYYRLRKQKELAAAIASRINRQIDSADRNVRSLVEAIDFLNRLQSDPAYKDNVRLASEYSNAIVQKLAAVDPVTGQTIYTGPLGNKYTFDFTPDKIPSRDSLRNMQDLLAEIETFSGDPNADPLLVRSWQNQKQYIEYHLLSAYATPDTGGSTQGWFDIYDWLYRGPFIRWLASPQNYLNRIASKQAQAVALTFQAADAFLEPLKVANENKSYGTKAINNLFYDAMQAHQFDPKAPLLRAKYEFLILDPILASLQNNLSAPLKVGQWIDGKYKVLAQDMALVQAMKSWSNEIQRHANPSGKSGSPALRFNPVQPQVTVGDLTVSRKPLGTGPAIMPRMASRWGAQFVKDWTSAPDDAARLALLSDNINFTGAVLGGVRETNPEYITKSEFQADYDEANRFTRMNLLRFDDFEALVDWLAARRQKLTPGATIEETRDNVRNTLIKEISRDVNTFSQKYLNAPLDEKEIQTIPESLRSILTGKNSFTAPREHLTAPSTYYSYSLASDPRKAQYIASARLIFELRQLESLSNLLQVLKTKLARMDAEMARGETPSALAVSRKRVKRGSKQAVRSGESFVAYQELKHQVDQLDTMFDQLVRLAQREYNEPNHVALGFAQGFTGLTASMLLARPQPSLTNLMGGAVFAPALIRLRMGRVLGALTTPVSTPLRLIQLATTKVASIVRHRPALASLWNGNRNQWGAIAKLIADSAGYYDDIQRRNIAVGGISPYDVKGRQKLLWRLKNTGGRLELSEPSMAMNVMNRIATLPGLSQLVAGVKAASPRWVDQVVNLMNTQEAVSMLDQLKAYGFKAWQMREKRGLPNWRDLTKPDNLLTPAELGAPSRKGADFLRQLFNPAGLLDKLTLDYYDRVKGMTPEQRANEPLIDDEGAVNAYILEYLKVTNLAAQSNRPPAFRGGILRPLATLFMGYPAALGEQISELFRRHSQDVGPVTAARNIAIVFSVLVMAVLAGMMAREPGQELTELVTGRTSGQLRLANVLSEAEPTDIARYALVSSANILPYFGDVANRSIGGVASKPFLDITSMVPIANFVNDTGNALLKIVTSKDPVYPITDWAKRWFPPLEPILNRIPVFAGDVEQRNALATLRAVAPTDMEVKQGFGASAPRLTTTSPIVRDLVAAAYLGDTDTVRQKFAEAVEEKRQQGVENPERAVWSTIQSRIPARSVFGRLPTTGEEARLLSRMTAGQRNTYDKSKAAFGLIADAVGKPISFTDTSQPRTTSTAARSPFGRRHRARRSLLGHGFGRRTRLASTRRRRVGFASSRRRSLAA